MCRLGERVVVDAGVFGWGNDFRPRRPRRLDTKTLLNPTNPEGKPALNTPRMSLEITKSHGSVPDA